MGAGVDKVLLSLRGREVATWAVEALDRCELVDSLTVVASEQNLERLAQVLDALPTRLPLDLIVGGARRQDSVRLAVEHLRARSPELVLVHDGARPLVSDALLRRCIEAAAEHGAATAGLPLKDAVKELDSGGFVRHSLERSSLVTVQTPQAFRYPLLDRAHRAGHEQGLVVDDDAELVERLGWRVRMVAGEPANLKITTPDDLAALEAQLASAGAAASG
jgi:2-C-methyl-D-erythritol 4-phosphate cytidylyltransferase